MESITDIEKCFLHRFIGHYEIAKYYEYHPGKPLVEAEYDGSKANLEVVLSNLTGTHRLRDYGLLHTMPFILKCIIESFDEENLASVLEINIAHSDYKLICLRNLHGDQGRMEVLHVDIGKIIDLWNNEHLAAAAAVKMNEQKSYSFFSLDRRSMTQEKLLIMGLVLVGVWLAKESFRR